MQKTKLNANPVGANCVRPHFEGMPKSNKGITLIALIITIIVMLILVGVTVNVALNGGLFTKAEQATQQMEASMIKEQFEIAKAVEIANNGGKKLEDYSIITIDKLDLDQSAKDKYKNKIFMSTEGDVCYNPDNVTEKEKGNFEAVGINPAKKVKTGYSFTLNKLGDCYVDEDSFIHFNLSKLWEVVGEDLSQNSNYILELAGTALVLETDNQKLKDYMLVNLGEISTDENTQYLVGAVLKEDVFLLKVLGVNGEELGDKLTEFLNEFGDVEFRIIETSSIVIPQ